MADNRPSKLLRRALRILRGLTCSHPRMRPAPCHYCVASGRRCDIVRCPDCGLSWDNSEGIYG